jgi:hypothetical protein
MTEIANSTLAKLAEEIRVRETELVALRTAFDVLQSDRDPHVRVMVTTTGQISITNVFDANGALAAGDIINVGADNGNGNHGDSNVAPDTTAWESIAPLSSRQRSAELLKKFSRRRPRDAASAAAAMGIDNVATAGLGMLVRHGYLKRKGTGYVRTAAKFKV